MAEASKTTRDAAQLLTDSFVGIVERMRMAEQPEDVLDLLLVIREAKRMVSDEVRDAEKLVAEMLDGIKDADIGEHHVEVKYAKQRKWTPEQNDDLRRAVSLIARYDRESGESRTPEETIRTFTDAYRCGGAEVRTTWMKKHDLDPDEYSAGDWKVSVLVTPKPTDQGSAA